MEVMVLGEEVAPGLAGGLDDGVVSLEHALGEMR
jgi:hypothetical protein